jgi:integrase
MGVKVRERKERPGEWWLSVHHRGVRFTKKVDGTKRDAETLAREVWRELVSGELNLPRSRTSTVPTFDAFADVHIARQEKRLKASSVERYVSAIDRYMRPRFGARPLDRIEARDLRAMVTDLEGEGLAPATVRHALKVARGLFELARANELRADNPARGVSASVSRKRPPEVEPLERDELAALLTKVTATMDPDDALRVLILARTGMRPGEVAALRVGDVDLRKGFAVVRRSYDDKHGVVCLRQACMRSARRVRRMPGHLDRRWAGDGGEERDGRRG